MDERLRVRFKENIAKIKALFNNLSNLRIRKLTPKECYRLMGFDDEDYENAKRVTSDSMLFHQAGDSIVVNVLEAILTNLLLEPVTTNPDVIEGQTNIYDYIGDSNE